jgi:hypothetical protein
MTTPMWVDRSGARQTIVENWDMLAIGGNGIPTLSPDGSQIAVSIGKLGSDAEVWISKLDGIMYSAFGISCHCHLFHCRLRYFTFLGQLHLFMRHMER